jgi:hypothetical protein
VEVVYDDSQTSVAVYMNEDFMAWEDFFVNSDVDNCPITSCALYEDQDDG